MPSNYYDVLGVSRKADEKEIRQAFRKLARQYHPDVNPGDDASEDKFKEINEAHSVLSDPEKRRKYDRYGDQWEHADQMGNAGGQGRSGRTATWTDFGDLGFQIPTGGGGRGRGSIFDHLFSNLGSKQGADRRPPAATEIPVEVTLEEAFEGATRLLDLPGGRRGEVKIPPGVDSGSRVRIPTGGGREGNIYLIVTVKPHTKFERKGHDLYCDVEVPLEDVVLGGEVTVPTLRGQVALTIPPGTQNGQRFRMSRQGMPGLNQTGSRGNLYATIKAQLPTELTPEELDLFRQLKDLRAAKDQQSDS
jgi:DnaJ-class molecular chaperone